MEDREKLKKVAKILTAEFGPDAEDEKDPLPWEEDLLDLIFGEEREGM
jgi:hypothetical protein